jgi:eukaryotic-like serine/threonine-protein kinase
MTPSRCPPREELERLLDDRLEPAALRRVSEHVAACPACQTSLDGLTADPGPGASSWHGLAPADPAPPPDFLGRIKQPRPETRTPPAP